MGHILVSGIINIETTLRVEQFPVNYHPVHYPFFGIRSTVSGVGYNIARALNTLGNPIRFLSMRGNDAAGQLVQTEMERIGLLTDDVLINMTQTAQSVVLYDETGKRMIFTDLKDIQEQHYPEDRFDAALVGADLAVLTNINYNRPLLARAQAAGIPIICDVHAIADPDDHYNRDFMATAQILFMSHERLPHEPERWAQTLIDRFGTSVIVIGLGKQGALLVDRETGFMARLPAQTVRPVVNTIGAGDALLSAFVHAYHAGERPQRALQKAILFAGHKIGATGAAEGFLDEDELNNLFRQFHPYA